MCTVNEALISSDATPVSSSLFWPRRLNVTGPSNSEQSLAYAELYAPTLGLGTTIMGFIETCLRADYTPLRELLQIPTKQVGLAACS